MELWDSAKTSREAIEFCAGWDNKPKQAYDYILIPEQLRLVREYSAELHRQKLLTRKQHDAIIKGTAILCKKYRAGELSIEGYEDVHSFVESKLHEMHGEELAGNVYLGLSRNDQIATLMRMWMKKQASAAIGSLKNLISAIQSERRKKGNTAFVGYTHHRVAMPTTYGELLRAYATGLSRDEESLKFWLKQYDECPLGSGAGFGTPVRINRHSLARKLGFRRAAKSPIDIVTTRWEPEAKLADIMKIMMNHLNTIAQDFIINSMEGINVISLPAEYCTGSSIMPQKRNPDVLETIKRKAIDISGEAFKLASVGRGNISGYNRDTQGAKYWIINVFWELEGCLEIMGKIIKGIHVNEKRAEELLNQGNACSAEEAIKEAVQKRKPYRRAKIELEKRLKDGAA